MDRESDDGLLDVVHDVFEVELFLNPVPILKLWVVVLKSGRLAAELLFVASLQLSEARGTDFVRDASAFHFEAILTHLIINS